MSDEELDDSKSTVSNATSNASKSTAKASKKKKGNYCNFFITFFTYI